VNAIDVAQNITIWSHNFYVFISISIRCNQPKIWTALLLIFYYMSHIYWCLYHWFIRPNKLTSYYLLNFLFCTF